MGITGDYNANKAKKELEKDRIKTLDELKDGKFAFGSFREELRDDKEIAKLAIEKDWKNFEYVSDRLKDSEDFIEFALEKDPSNFEYVSDRLKDNEDFVKFAIEKWPSIFQYVSDRLKDNEEIAKLAIKKWRYGFKYTSDRLKDNEEIAKFAINEWLSNLEYVSDRLKDNEEIAKLSILRNRWKFVYLGGSLKSNEEIIKLASRQSTFDDQNTISVESPIENKKEEPSINEQPKQTQEEITAKLQETAKPKIINSEENKETSKTEIEQEKLPINSEYEKTIEENKKMIEACLSRNDSLEQQVMKLQAELEELKKQNALLQSKNLTEGGIKL